MSSVPPSLLPLATYFERASELSRPYPFVSHQLRLFGVELAMKMRHPDAGAFLMAQLDVLEAEKKDAKHTTPPTFRQAQPRAVIPKPAVAPVDVSDAAGAKADPKRKTDDKVESTDTEEKEEDAKDDKKEESKGGIINRIAKAFDKKDDKKDDGKKDVGEASAAMEKAAIAEPAPTLAPVEYKMVAQTPQDAIRRLGFDFYERARAADNPKAYPSASTSWGVVDAPKIARGLHAAAVVLDCLKRFGALPADVVPFQTGAHKRSQQLSSQINAVFKTGPPIPASWAPVDTNAPFANFKPQPARPPPAAPETSESIAALFPSAGTAPVKR